METAEERTRHLEMIREVANSSPFYRHVQMQVTKFTPQGCIMTMIVEHQHTNLSSATPTAGLSRRLLTPHVEYRLP